MSHSKVIKHNRVFLDPGNSNPISTTLTADYSSITSESTPIQVTDTNNFTPSGFITINNEDIYYGNKTVNSFQNIKRAMNNTSAGDHSINNNVFQSKSTINDNNTVDTQLSGWFINGKSNQASLRVFDAPVILPGVIRLKQKSDNTYKFQGCTDYSSSTPTWVDFNATQGDKGDTGDINTILRFSNVGSSNPSGQIIKTTNLTINNNSSTPSQIEVRGIAPGSTTVNNESVSTIGIENSVNDVILTSKPLPYTWNLSRPLSDLKNTTGNTLNSFGDVVSMYVVPGKSVSKGQVLTSNTFISNSVTYIGVEPLTYNASSIDDLQGLNNNANTSFIGISKQDGDASSLTDFEVSNIKVSIVTNGLGIIKIDNNNPPNSIIGQNQTPTKSGRPCILSTTGYGLNTNEITITTDYFRVGKFIENNVALNTNNYAIVKINPEYIDF